MKFDYTFVKRTFIACTLFSFTIAFLTGHSFFGIAYQQFCLLCSALWLASLHDEIDNLLAEYIDSRKQRRLKFSLLFGITATVLSFGANAITNATAIAALLAWTLYLARAIHTRNQYVQVERGLVPADTWIDPPAGAFAPGDVFGSSGVWWEPNSQSFAHCELISGAVNPAFYADHTTNKTVPADFQNETLAVSSCAMEQGTYIHTIEDALINCQNQHHLKEGYERWFCARLTDAGLRDLKLAAGENWIVKLNKLVEEKKEKNTVAKVRENSRRHRLIDSIAFISDNTKQALKAKFRASGYNWLKMAFANAESLICDLRKVAPATAQFLFGESEADESDLCSTHVMSILLGGLNLGTMLGSNPHRSYLPYGFANPVLPLEVLLLKSAKGEPYFRLLNKDDERIYKAAMNRKARTATAHKNSTCQSVTAAA